MHCKPMIGLSANYRDQEKQTPAYSYVAAGYYDAISAAGGVPVIVPPQDDEANLHCILDRLDGFLLASGADLDPRQDGYMLHPSVRLQSSRREHFDRQLMRLIAARRMPVFGIGSGMQLMNVVLGGNLFLHIPEDLPDAIPHRDPHDLSHRHGLQVTPGSLMDRVFGDGEIRVNSRHHMAVDEVAPGFQVTARCPDGVVEAIESAMDDWFAVGAQFHPESEAASALDIRLFEEFIEGIQQARPLRMVA